MEAQGGKVTCSGLQGYAVAEPPLNSVPSCVWEDYGTRVEVKWGRQMACPEVLSLWAMPGPRTEWHQAEGIFQLDQLLSRNRVPTREECSTWDWKV